MSGGGLGVMRLGTILAVALLAAMSPDKVFHPIYVAILLRRNDQTLLNYINIWLDQIELDGTLGKIRTKWLGDTR